MIGYGKELTYDDIHDGSAFLVKSLAKSYPEYPHIPLDFVGHTLSEISSEEERVVVSYLDFSSKNEHISMSIQKCSCQESISPNLAEPNSEFWQIGNTVIKVGGSVLDKNSEISDQYKEYEVQFFKDGYQFRITGKNIDFIKQEIIANYFPECDFEDIFLISKTSE